MPLDPARDAPRWLGHLGQLALAAILAGLLLPPSLESVSVGGASTAWTVALVASLLVLHLGVGTARRWPVASFAGGAFACLVLLGAPDITGVTGFVDGGAYGPILLPSVLCYFMLLYAVSAHATSPWPNVALGLGLAGGVLALVRLWGFTGLPIDTWAWWLLLATTAFGGTIAAWALARYRVTRSAWATQLAARAAADERSRIAREMHDVVAHSLAVMVSQAEAGRLVTPRDPERAPDILGTIADTGRGALTEMRGLLGLLGEEEGSADPQPGLADVPALIDKVRAAGIDVELEINESLRARPAAALTVYRVIQEALTNVTRHAGPDPTVRVSITGADEHLDVLVTNSGSPSSTRTGTGRGLDGMRERVTAVGGTLSAGPVEGGWQVSARMPS